MKKNTFAKLIAIFISISFIFFLFLPFALAETLNLKNAFGDTLKDASLKAGYSQTTNADPDSVISTVIKLALSFLGVVFMILLVYAGYLWMTARGDSGQVDKAKDIIREAIIGLIIVAMAYAISSFILSKVWNTEGEAEDGTAANGALYHIS